MEVKFKKCGPCGRKTRHERPTANHIAHLIITVLSCGLWLPIWLLIAIQFGGWHCSGCGS